MRFQGAGLDNDYHKAAIGFKKFAEQGYPDAQFRFGESYAEGKGKVQNLKLADFWLNLAETNGIQPAEQIKKHTWEKLSLQVLEEANRIAYQLWIRLKN